MSLSTRAEDNQQHDPWRVILVGRTGLDQALRCDERIELIRSRDTIDAMGELSDPIDGESPEQAVVIVAADAEPDDREIARFITGLRLIDPGVRVLRVGEPRDAYDGAIEPESELDRIVVAIERAEHPPEPVALRFVDSDEPAAESVPGPASDPEPEPTTEPGTAHAAETERQDQRQPPEIAVAVQNEHFTHRAQMPFEQESAIHRSVIMGIGEDDQHPPARRTQSEPVFVGPHDDQPVVEAMLAGRAILGPALQRVNARVGRSDIRFETADHADGVPVRIGDTPVGALVCDDARWLAGPGRSMLQGQAAWLATWIRLEKQQGELRRCAFTDMLTGAWNRRYFTRFLDAAIEQSRAARQPLTVMLFDIDDFKHYNDAYGHAAGDDILVETVRLLKSVIRPSDRVCRVGGDEFVVIFYEPSGPRDPRSKPLESVYQIACRFQKQICQHRFPKLGAEAMGTLTISGGLASFPWDGHDARSLLEKADELAMASKAQGKNAITLGPGAESICHNKR